MRGSSWSKTRWLAPVMRRRVTCAVTPSGKARTISCSAIRFEDGMISPTRALISALFPQAGPLETRQHLVAEERQLVDVVDQRHGDPRQARTAQIDELARH